MRVSTFQKVLFELMVQFEIDFADLIFQRALTESFPRCSLLLQVAGLSKFFLTAAISLLCVFHHCIKSRIYAGCSRVTLESSIY